MNGFKIISFALVGAVSIGLAGCGKDLSDSADLLSSSAHCTTAQDFGSCLLASYVNHPASLAFPEELDFSPHYARIVQTGYDRELRRKDVNKYVDIDLHKQRNIRNFAYNDMYLYARQRTPDGTQNAIDILAKDSKAGIGHLDAAMAQWLENPAIFDQAFAHALLMRYRKSWIHKSSLWDHTGMTPGQSPFEVLSRAFVKIGDKAVADKLIADMEKQKFYPLRTQLEPVYQGRRALNRMNGKTLREAGLSLNAIAPLINKQIEKRTAPNTVLSSLAFAIRHGHADPQGQRDALVEAALDYAYKNKDKGAIVKFADRVLTMPIDFSNNIGATMKRSDRLQQDLALVRYLAAIGDQERIGKIAKKWDPLSTPLANGELPSWTGTSTFRYTEILHHARRSSDVQKYVQSWGGKIIRFDADAEFTASRVSKAVTLERLKQIENELSRQSEEKRQSFYKSCAHEAGIEFHKYEVRTYCASKIQSPKHRIQAKLKISKSLYEDGKKNEGRLLLKDVLVEAANCSCIEEKPFSNQSYYLADIILAELEN